MVEEEELAKASGTEHHGGVCFLIKKRQGLDAETYLQQQTQAKDCVLALEDVGNPHNLGGIMRTLRISVLTAYCCKIRRCWSRVRRCVRLKVVQSISRLSMQTISSQCWIPSVKPVTPL